MKLRTTTALKAMSARDDARRDVTSSRCVAEVLLIDMPGVRRRSRGLSGKYTKNKLNM